VGLEWSQIPGRIESWNLKPKVKVVTVKTFEVRCKTEPTRELKQIKPKSFQLSLTFEDFNPLRALIPPSFSVTPWLSNKQDLNPTILMEGNPLPPSLSEWRVFILFILIVFCFVFEGLVLRLLELITVLSLLILECLPDTISSLAITPKSVNCMSS
jgi:hypothetical protein